MHGYFFCKLFIYLFVFGYAGSSLLHGLGSSCSEPGLLSSCGTQASHCVASLVAEHGLSSCGKWA